MEKTNKGMTTPGGRPGKNLVNPPSSEVGPMDSGGGQLLLGEDPFRRGSLVARSPPVSYTHLDVYKRQTLGCNFLISSCSRLIS